MAEREGRQAGRQAAQPQSLLRLEEALAARGGGDPHSLSCPPAIAGGQYPAHNRGAFSQPPPSRLIKLLQGSALCSAACLLAGWPRVGPFARGPLPVFCKPQGGRTAGGLAARGGRPTSAHPNEAAAPTRLTDLRAWWRTRSPRAWCNSHEVAARSR